MQGMSYKADRVYHVQYFGPQALRGWTNVGMIMPFEGRDAYFKKASLESGKAASPKAQTAKLNAKYIIKQSHKKQWDLSVEEAEKAIEMPKEERVKSLTFEYVFSSKVNLRRKADSSIEGESDAKRKKLSSSPEDIYDFDDDADNVNLSQSTPGLMWRKRVQKGDFATFAKQHLETVRKENPGLNKKQLNDMLQKRWDLLGDDLRALYIDRKAQNNENDSSSITTPKTTSTKKQNTDSSKRKSNPIRKQRSKQNITIDNELEQNDSNASDSEGNLVIAETPIKRTPIKKNAKSSAKKDLNITNDPNLSEAKKYTNSDKKEVESNASQVNKSAKKSVGKVTKSRKSSVTPIAKKKEENTNLSTIEKPIIQNTDQTLAHLGIDYLDEFTSSEETSSTSEPEVNDGLKTSSDRFCASCNDEESESLLPCQGSCLQMFHRKCAKYEGIDNQFKCSECESGINSKTIASNNFLN
jgi:hypothetical protein